MQSPSECIGKNRPIIKAIDPRKGVIVFFRATCKQWSCPACAADNARRWAMATHKALVYYQTTEEKVLFCTITSHEKIATTAGTIYVFKQAWPKLYKRALREYGGLTYFGIPEQTEKGKLHLHFFTPTPIKQKWLKDNARACGLGFMAKIKPVDDPKSGAYYVTKYLHKSLTATVWPKNFRRIRKSKNWFMLPQEYGGEFQFAKLDEPLNRIWDEYVRRGFTAIFAEGKLAWEFVNLIDNFSTIQ